MKIRIRNVDPRKSAIATTLTYLQKKCLPYDQPYDTTQGWWWIAYDGNKPVAFAGIVRSMSWSDCGYLCRAGVLASHRGLGLQKRLIAIRTTKAKKIGYKWLISDTRDNHPSANSLAKLGFKMFTPTNPWGYNDTLYWRKRLDAVQRPRNKKTKAQDLRKKALRKK